MKPNPDAIGWVLAGIVIGGVATAAVMSVQQAPPGGTPPAPPPSSGIEPPPPPPAAAAEQKGGVPWLYTVVYAWNGSRWTVFHKDDFATQQPADPQAVANLVKGTVAPPYLYTFVLRWSDAQNQWAVAGQAGNW